jgi:hypothetical protein
MKFEFQAWHAFVLGTVLAWGVYVPVLHEGQSQLGGAEGPKGGSMRAFLCVGLAYVLTAVIIPLILFALNLTAGEKLSFAKGDVLNTRGLVFAGLGGITGAAGALGIILSLKFGGRPIFIVPLVFAGAPIVSSIVSLLWHPPEDAGVMFYAKFCLGIVLAAGGAGLVLYSKSELDAIKMQKQKASAALQTAQLSGAEPSKVGG